MTQPPLVDAPCGHERVKTENTPPIGGVFWSGAFLSDLPRLVETWSNEKPCRLHMLGSQISLLGHCGFWAFKLTEGSLEVKLPTICRDGKAEVRRVREEKSRSEKIRDGESQKRQDAGARKGREVTIHCVFPMISGSGGSKSRLA